MDITIWSITRRNTRAHGELSAARKAISIARHLQLIEEFERGFDYRVKSDRQVSIGSMPVSAQIRVAGSAAEDRLRWTLRIDLGFLIFLIVWCLMLLALPALVVRTAFLPIARPGAVQPGFEYVGSALIYIPFLLALLFLCHRIRLDVRSMHWLLRAAAGTERSEPLRDFRRETRTAKAFGFAIMGLFTLASLVFLLLFFVRGQSGGIVSGCMSLVFMMFLIMAVVYERRRR